MWNPAYLPCNESPCDLLAESWSAVTQIAQGTAAVSGGPSHDSVLHSPQVRNPQLVRHMLTQITSHGLQEMVTV